MQKISPQKAQTLIAQGAILVDIRSEQEFDDKQIQGSFNLPVDRINSEKLDPYAGKTVIFSCLGGMRTEQNCEKLAQCAEGCGECYILEGGFQGWQKAGLPISVYRNRLELNRQVQIIAGGLTLLGVLLGSTISPYFYALSAFIGAGLLFAGISGFCGLARLLMLMPWNK